MCVASVKGNRSRCKHESPKARGPKGTGIVTLQDAMARQRLGQHFLANPSWRERILRTLSLADAEVWIEIGAGHGEMTQSLAGGGRRVLAIESDARLGEGLRERATKWPGVQVICGDALKVDLGKLGGSRFRIYGNLPYYITAPLLRHMFHFAGQITSIHIVLQFEVAARIVARPGRRAYGYLSTLSQYYAHSEIVFQIPPGAFRPPPRVSSALVEMKLPGERAGLGVADEPGFLKFVQACFGQKRKTLRNNLRLLTPDERGEAALAACGIREDARAEQLSLRQFASLHAHLSRNE